MPGGPEVVAHRGSSAQVPEHTLSAYRRAIEQGADALECDVRLTADQHLVCVHDRTVNRTSNGRGVVSALELAHLEGLDWASWMASPEQTADPDETPDRDAGRLLTLRRLLDVVRDCGRPVRLAIETKHPTRHAGQVERTLARVLAEYGWDGAHPRHPSPVRVMSFSPLALQRMRQRVPGVPLVLLVKDRLPARLRSGLLPPGVGATGLSLDLLQRYPGVVRQVQARGGRVHVWTVDHEPDVALCLAAGVDAVITNRPQHVLALLGRGRTSSR